MLAIGQWSGGGSEKLHSRFVTSQSLAQVLLQFLAGKKDEKEAAEKLEENW